MQLQRCKGMRDLSPEDMAVFRQIEGGFRDCCLKWGYREVRTPTIEYLHLFTSAGRLTPSMLGKVYSFLDWDGWSGERVVLRPDGTIPVARLYIENRQDRGLARLFYATNIFIFEETGKKTRERWQCGTELIGVGSPLADAELIALSLEVLKKLGLNGVVLRLSHAGLIKALLARMGLSPEEQTKLFDQILDGNTAILKKISRKNPDLDSVLLPLLGRNGQTPGFLKNLKAVTARSLPEASAHIDALLETVAILDAIGCDYQIDIASGAGFEYYTGMIFQLFVSKEKIGGGGRYDALIPSMGGGEVPASGFALYLDRLMALVKLDAITSPWHSRVLVRARPEDDRALKNAFYLAGVLRESGYVAEMALEASGSSDTAWVIDVRAKSPLFIVQGRENTGKLEARTARQVVKWLGGRRGD